MSDPPLAPTPFSGKKKSHNGGTNVNKKLLMEFQALIAYACYNSPSPLGASVLMTESMMEKLMMKRCFGDNNDDEMVCYVDQFLLGLNKFKGLYTAPPRRVTDVNTGVPSELRFPPSLHCQGKIHIFVGEGSIEKRLLSQKSLTKET